LTDNNAETSRVNHNTVSYLTFPRSKKQTSLYKLLLGQIWTADYPLLIFRELIYCH